MEESARLVDQFETHRAHLRAVAYRMLGSTGEADDAVQEAWLRVSRSGTDGVENLGGWLTTIVSRVCLDMLRSRRSRREAPLEEPDVRMPDPIVGRGDRIDPEQEALLGDSVGLALLVVLQSLSRRNVSRSYCTTCSACPSEKSGRSWDVPRQRRGNSRAARAGGCGGRPLSLTRT
jgi:RNA polymerase sigma factor (sigma-70 family)